MRAMKTLHSNTALAALSESNEQAVAACSFSIDIEQPWNQILPFGEFSARDGRPFETPNQVWRIDNENGRALAALLAEQTKEGEPLLFDYEHQTLNAAKNGQPAPASAFGEEYEWRDNKGLFVKPAFTEKARVHIKSREYTKFSPVIRYNKTTGDVLSLHSVALTNKPALAGMQAAAALSADTTLTTVTTNPNKTEKTMNENLAWLLSVLGLKGGESIAACTEQLESDAASTALNALKNKLELAEQSEQKIADLTEKLNNVSNKHDLSKFVPVAIYNKVVEEMAALSESHQNVTVEQVIDDAKKQGKFIATAELSYLTELGNQDIAALKENLAMRPVIGALGGNKQTLEAGSKDAADADVAALTEVERDVMKQLGMDEKTFLENR